MNKENKNFLIRKIYISELKGIKDCELLIDNPLIAIMGVNGIGKSTIIHALACSFRPDSATDERMRFFEFFPPTNNKSWKDSKFSLELEYSYNDPVSGERQTELINRTYGKAFDRWSPRYDNQPYKNVCFIGIDTCCPEIEKFKFQRATFKTTIKNDKASNWVIEKASYILNKTYECLLDNDFNKRNYLGVKTKDNIQYSALSMGAGEQRIFRILFKLYNASAYSLFLIDEIDILLHSDALRKLVEIMYEVAIRRHLQIIFTTHSLVMEDLKKYVSIKYLDRLSDKTVVYNGITSTAWNKMSGTLRRPIRVFVEDELARTIVRDLAKDVGISGKVDIDIFGSIENSFTLASAMVIRNEDVSNQLIITDGDRYTTKESQMVQIQNRLTGNEIDAETKREKAVGLINHFILPEKTAPEKFIIDILKASSIEDEIIYTAKEIRAVNDSHDWVSSIIRTTNCSYFDIVSLCKRSDMDKWSVYTKPIREWFAERINL